MVTSQKCQLWREIESEINVRDPRVIINSKLEFREYARDCTIELGNKQYNNENFHRKRQKVDYENVHCVHKQDLNTAVLYGHLLILKLISWREENPKTLHK